jgi:hypothetical protein
MTTAYLAVTLTAVAANGFSDVAALLHLNAILPAMHRAGVPESWLTFPIGTLKAAGAIGLAVGLLGWRPVGIAAGDRPCAVLRLRHLHPHPRQRLANGHGR